MKEIIDLAYGNPGFLQELWQSHNFLTNLSSHSLMPYKFGKQSSPSLAEEIKLLHKNQRNVLITESTRIVITVGAVQALQAAMYAYQKVMETKTLYVPEPYWTRFDDFARINGLTISTSEAEGAISLITSPNNPNGVDQSDKPAHIRDACYNWTHYTKNVKEFEDKVVLFSLAKLSGHASTRIGWAVVHDVQLGKFMQYYVNTITSGVSVEAQESALGIIKHLNQSPDFFVQGNKILENRYQQLEDLITQKSLPIKVLSTQGMFWYIQCDPKLIAALVIDCSAGEEFKDTQPDTFRINLGCSQSIFFELFDRMRNL